MSAPLAKNFYFSGAGQVYVSPKDPTTGEPTCFRAVGNVTALTLDFSISKTAHKSSQDCTRGTDYETIDEVAVGVQSTWESIDPENLALGLYGEQAIIGAASAVTETITATVFGCWKKLNHIAIAEGTLTVTQGGTALVEGDDFQVDYKSGMVRLLETGAGDEAQPFDVQYDHAGFECIQGLTDTTPPEVWMRYAGLNCAGSSSPVVVDIFRASLDPLTGLPLIGSDVANYSMNMTALADSSRTDGSNYFRVCMVPTATT